MFMKVVMLIVTGAALALVFGFRPVRRWWRAREARGAINEFRLRREMLEAKFLDVARLQGKPRGLHWKQCDWQSPVTFARDVSTGLLTAFVAVEIHFEAVAGGDMEDVAAVGTIRDAAAVFHYQHQRLGHRRQGAVQPQSPRCTRTIGRSVRGRAGRDVDPLRLISPARPLRRGTCSACPLWNLHSASLWRRSIAAGAGGSP